MGGQGQEGGGKGGEEGESSASTRPRRNLSSAVHYWNSAATISFLWDALLLVQLVPAGELARRKGVGSRKGETPRVRTYTMGIRLQPFRLCGCVVVGPAADAHWWNGAEEGGGVA